MKDIKRPINIHEEYHAHVYFEPETLEVATDICKQVEHLFGLRIGKIHRGLVGPHLMWSCQISFFSQHFAQFIPWIDKNRQGLSIFVHGVTGDDLKDHTDFAYWLGDSVELKLSMFRE